MKSVTNHYENLGGGGSGLACYVTEKYKISTIISPKFQYIVCLFRQNSVQTSKCIAVLVGSCTYFTIILTYNYVCLLLKSKS